MVHTEQFEKARNAAYRFLTYRARTEYQMAEKLFRKGFDGETVNQVIENLREYNMLNDEAYAGNYVAGKSSRPRAVLAGELRRLGVRETAIENALEGVNDRAEFRVALALAMNKRKNRATDYPLVYIAGLLRRRGFSQDTVDRVCEYLENIPQS